MAMSYTDRGSRVFSPSLATPGASRSGIPDEKGTRLDWSILIPIIAGGCALVLIAVIISVVLCRRRYVIYEGRRSQSKSSVRKLGHGDFTRWRRAMTPGLRIRMRADRDATTPSAASDASDPVDGAVEG
jgi:hypothetical protein